MIKPTLGRVFLLLSLSLFILHLIQISETLSSATKIPFRLSPYTFDPAFSPPLNTSKSKRLIILLTSFRGGSSFLGKLFDENPTVQYLFEPFHSGHIRWMYKNNKLHGAGPHHTRYEHYMLYLQQIVQCGEILPSWVAYVERWRLCGTAHENLQRFGSDVCPGNLTYKGMMTDVCKFRATSAVKVIRMRRLRDVLLIKNIKEVDVRIVHFIRHPVGIMHSRVGWRQFAWIPVNQLDLRKSWYTARERATMLAWEAHTYCADVMETRRSVERDPWLRERYLSVTHVQLSLEPVDTARTIYHHVGLAMGKDMEEFVRNTTQGLAEDKYVEKGYISTSRVSKDVVLAWKAMDKLSRFQINVIDAVCSRLMAVMEEKSSFESLDLNNILRLYYPS